MGLSTMRATNVHALNFFKIFATICAATLIVAATLNRDTVSLNIRQSIKLRLQRPRTFNPAGETSTKLHLHDVPTIPRFVFPQYLYGKWQFLPSPQSNASGDTLLNTCCSQANEGYDPITHEKVEVSRCTSASFGGALGEGQIAFGWGNWCACAVYKTEEKLKEQGRKRESGTWRWAIEGDTKLMPPFDAEKFCHALGKRKLALVGDSTMQQTWTSLVNLVAGQSGLCLKQMEYFASDFLAPQAELSLSHDVHKERGRSMVETLRPFINGTDEVVVVLGVAAHFNHLEQYKEVLKWVGNYIVKHRRLPALASGKNGRFSFYFKTANPPHFNCRSYSDPWLSWQVDFKENMRARYKYWRQAMLYDELAVEILDGKLNGIIDMTPLYLRPDAHASDCLHYCMNSRTGTALDLFATKLQLALSWPSAVIV